ncbi:MAG: class I SAM-dependent methyltransferase [Flavobacteriaceae bacterium]|nr:class I SAM-dependent methyltransferase [Flavobacteriaceae bacterium]
MSQALNITSKNRQHYNERYKNVSIAGIEKTLSRLDAYLDEVTVTDTSWVAMFRNDFRNQLQGKKVLELGCGDCRLVAVMVALGAEVTANDIADKSGDIVAKINASGILEKPIGFVQGDFLKAVFPAASFDLVVGKAFVHHLTHEQEAAFYQKIAQLLKPGGEVRFVEPAVNSKLLDTLRWMVPVKGRPSSLQTKKFAHWKANDPHPERDNSSKHYKELGLNYFKEVEIIPIGALERFHRLFPKSKNNRAFRKKAYWWESKMSLFIQHKLARAHTVIFRKPIPGKAGNLSVQHS